MINSVKQTMGQFISLLLSFFVIHYYTKNLWGSFASYFFFVNACLLISAWGNKEYLIREFSKAPNKMMANFYQLFNTRLLLLPLCFIVTFLFYDWQESMFIILWILGGYISQSLEVIWIYHRDYFRSIAVEIVSFGLLLALLYMHNNLLLFTLIQYYSYYQIIRALAYILLYYTDLKAINFEINPKYFAAALPFFVLGFVGFLQSRTDFLLVILFEKKENIAVYQVLNTYFILIHALGTFLIFPFMKNLYRVQLKTIQSMQNLMIMAAPFIVVCSLGMLYLILHFFYHFHLDFYYYLIGFFITFPPYLYAIKIIRLFRENRQSLVVRVGIEAIIINSLLTYLLLYFGFGLKGALIGAAMAQIYSAVQYLKNGST
jgi:hypothetical protein